MATPKDPFASFTDPRTGKAMLVPQGKAPIGTPFRVSEGIDPTTGMTASGDASNRFRGYVAPDGGGFGSAKGRQGFETVTGVSADKLGLGADAGDDAFDAFTKQFSGIANRDKASIDQGLASDNDFLKRTANAYKFGRGSQGLTDDEYARVQKGEDINAPQFDFTAANAVAAERERTDTLAAASAPRKPVDPYGRNEATTATANVIKPGQNRMAQTSPIASDSLLQPDNPFSAFAPRNPLVGQAPVGSVITSQAPTFDFGNAAGPANTPMADAMTGPGPGGPLDGGGGGNPVDTGFTPPGPPTDRGSVPTLSNGFTPIAGVPSAPVGMAGGFGGFGNRMARGTAARRGTGRFDRYRKMKDVGNGFGGGSSGLPSGGAFAL